MVALSNPQKEVTTCTVNTETSIRKVPKFVRVQEERWQEIALLTSQIIIAFCFFPEMIYLKCAF